MNPRVWTKEVTQKEFVFAFFDLLLLVVPGAGILFLFNQAAFESIDWIKIMLLSGAITAPLSFMNMLFLTAIDDDFKPKRKGDLFFELSVSIVITTLLLYAWAVISYLLWNSSGRTFAIALIVSELIFGFGAAIKEWHSSAKQRAASSHEQNHNSL